MLVYNSVCMIKNQYQHIVNYDSMRLRSTVANMNDAGGVSGMQWK